jgi:hypothetical protein
MRSIAWESKSEPHEPLDDVPDPGCGELPIEEREKIKEILAKFDDDPVAQKIVLLVMQGARGKELRLLSGLDEIEYESKRRKIRRRIEKHKLLADE